MIFSSSSAFSVAAEPPQPRQVRPFRTDVIIGSPGMGKTTLAEEWIGHWIRERQGRGVLRGADPNRQFRHLGAGFSWPGEDNPEDMRLPEARAEEWIRGLAKERVGKHTESLPPCEVVLDDADVYMSSGSPRGGWRHFLMTFRHWRCDVIAIGRRPAELPKVLFQNASTLAIFATNEPHSVEYLRALIGDDNLRKIPTQPHRYLLVDMRTKSGAVFVTAPRRVVVAADRA